MFFLRSLVPSWRFFNHSMQSTELYFRFLIRGNSEKWSQWSSSINPTPPRTLKTLFHNPNDTKRLALFSLLDQSLFELETTPDFKATVSYSLILNWVLKTSIETYPEIEKIQFKIIVDSKEKFISYVHEY